jgi:hypothetical protein
MKLSEGSPDAENSSTMRLPPQLLRSSFFSGGEKVELFQRRKQRR